MIVMRPGATQAPIARHRRPGARVARQGGAEPSHPSGTQSLREPRAAASGVATGGADHALTTGARWLTAGTLTVGLINYAYAFALTRLLATGVYADFAAGQALLLTAGTVAAVSVPWVLAHELVRRPDGQDRRRAVWFATLLNLAQGMVGGAAVGLVALSFSNTTTSLAIAASTLLIFLSSTSLGWFQGGQRFRLIAVRGVLEVSAKALAGLALVWIGAGAAGALAAFGIGAFTILALGTWFMRSDYRPASGALRNRDLWLSARGVTGIQGLVSVLASVDVVLVAVLPVPPAAAASYQASMILARIPLFLAGAVAGVAFPMLGSPGASPSGLLRSGTRLYLWVALPLALVLATASPSLLALAFPSSFNRVAGLLPLTALAGLLIGYVELITTFYQAGGHYRSSVRRQLSGVVFSLVAVPAAWTVWGVTGIALAACCGAGVSVLLLVLHARRLWPARRPPLLNAVGACVALAAILLIVRRYPVPWLVLAAAVLAGCTYAAFLRTPRAPLHGRTAV